jgi:hypothetical protein
LCEDSVDKKYDEREEGSRANEDPDNMASNDPREKGADVIDVPWPERANAKPLEVDIES